MSHKLSSCEVLVAGGGIIGAACARAAALRGLRVLICEPGPDPAAASAASAGILGPQIERTDETLRSEEHTSELQSLAYLVCRLLLEKKKKISSPLLDKVPLVVSTASMAP